MCLQKFLPHLSPFRLLAYYWRDGVWHLDLKARRHSAACPCCRHRSTAVHSAYRRTVADVPIAGTQGLIHVQVRRFFCRHAACPRRIFAEQFPTHRRGFAISAHIAGGNIGSVTIALLGVPLIAALGWRGPGTS